MSSNPMQQATLSGVKNVIAVGAGKGGVGKSTLSVMIAAGLVRRGFKVGLLDADVYGPSIPKMLGIEDGKPMMSAENVIAPILAHQMKVMSIGFLVEPDRPIIWRGPMIHGTIKQFLDQVDWAPLDYLIVDLPPGTGDVPLTLSQSIPMTGAVVVCTPQDVALLDAVRAARMYQQLNVDVLGIVENMSYFIAPDTGREYDLFGKGGAAKAADRLKVPFLGAIPINIAVRFSGDEGTPTRMFDDPAAAGVSEAIFAVVDSLVRQVSLRDAAKPGPELRIHS
jgi:ATP-binding protein involved in chromosome partitioning